MIPALAIFVALFLLLLGAVLMAESETMQRHSKRRAVNRLADESRKHKPQGMRPRSRYIRAGIQKQKGGLKSERQG